MIVRSPKRLDMKFDQNVSRYIKRRMLVTNESHDYHEHDINSLEPVMPLKLDYIEFSSPELDRTQAFFQSCFGWEFVNYGDDYRDIQNAGLGGGIARGPHRAPMPILKTDRLEDTLEQIRAAGAEVTAEIFDFPGGRRFQFIEPGGTEMGVWSES